MSKLPDAKRGLSCLLAGCFLLMLSSLGFAAEPAKDGEKRETTPPHILKAIKKGIAYLKKQQQADGRFTGQHHDAPGQTALAVYALRHSGVPADDPVIAKAVPVLLEYARRRPGVDHHGTYNAGLVCVALESLHNQKGYIAVEGSSPGEVQKSNVRKMSYKREIQACAGALVRTQGPQGGWAYGARGKEDLSNTQYAILGLWAAKRAGVSVPKSAFQRCASWLLSGGPKTNPQEANGSFRYRAEGNPTRAMTVGGISTLAIIHEQISRKRMNRLVPHPGKPSVIEKAVDKGFGWLEEQGFQNMDKYYLYGLERACSLTSTKKIGKDEWYRPIADKLVEEQDGEGSWNYRGKICGTAWGLLFLNRATEHVPYYSKESLQGVPKQK